MKVFRRLNRQQACHEIDDEVSLHLDLLTDELCRQKVPRDEARILAEARFGNVEQIRNQCAEISMRNSPVTRALTTVLNLAFLVGILVRILGTEYHVTRVGTVLITLGLLGRLFLYVRGLNPSRYLSKPDVSSQLILSEHGQVVAGFDQSGRTPLERLILDK